jgi:hypothetical protein
MKAIVDSAPEAPDIPATQVARRRSPLLALSGAFALVLLLGAIAYIVGGIEPEPDPLTGPSIPEGSTVAESVGLVGVGGDGPYFSIDDPSWTLDYAWEPDNADGASFILYENGHKQIAITTGSVAEEDLLGIEMVDSEVVSAEDASITKFLWNEGVSFAWRTSNQLPVVITFRQMSLDDAENAAGLLKSIHQATFADMLVSNPWTPTTLGSAPDSP